VSGGVGSVGGVREDMEAAQIRVASIKVQIATSDELIASTADILAAARRANEQARPQRRHLQRKLEAAEVQLSAAEQQICEEPCSKRAKVDENSSCPLFSSLGSDMLTRCASYLDPTDMVQLGRASTIFGRIQPGSQRSLVNEVSHQILFLGASKDERHALPKFEDESDIKLYLELLCVYVFLQ